MAIEPWQPTVRDGETLDDVPLSQWIGEALGAVSMCWNPRPTGVFDSTLAAMIADALHAHIQEVVSAVIKGTINAEKSTIQSWGGTKIRDIDGD